MPTPASGAISMANMNTEIRRVGSTSQVSMSEIRTRYGGSGQINFSDLRDCEGFTVTCGTYADKVSSYDGFLKAFSVGSVSPNEGNGMIQFATNSYLSGFSSQPQGTGSSASLSLADSTNPFSINNISVGYRGIDITRIVTANTSRSLGSGTNPSRDFTYDFPGSGTIHCLVKF